jgi:hypothetical protein
VAGEQAVKKVEAIAVEHALHFVPKLVDRENLLGACWGRAKAGGRETTAAVGALRLPLVDSPMGSLSVGLSIARTRGPIRARGMLGVKEESMVAFENRLASTQGI